MLMMTMLLRAIIFINAYLSMRKSYLNVEKTFLALGGQGSTRREGRIYERQILIVLSLLALAIVCPSALIAIASMASVCSVSV